MRFRSPAALRLAAIAAFAAVRCSSLEDDVRYYKAELGGTMNGLRRRQLGFLHLAVHPSWAPVAAQRFTDLVADKFYDGTKFYRVRSPLRRFVWHVPVSPSPGVGHEHIR